MNSDQGLEAAVLDAMHDLIAVLDRRGTIVLVNRAWREAALRNDAPPALAAGIGLNYLEACLHAEGDGSAGARQCHAGVLSALQGREGFELEYPCHSPTTQRWFLLRVLPLESPDGGVLVIHSEITERDQLARQLRGANRALHIRNACNRVLLRASAEAEALREVCRSIVDLGRYRFAWVGFVEDDAQKTVRPAAHAGVEDGYLACVLITSSEREHGRGPTGTAARTGKVALVRDIRSDPAYAPWRAEALKRGYRSSVALPFAADGVVGTLNVYAAEPDAFNPTEVDLLQELANDVSIRVAALRARAERDRAVESLRSSEKKFVTVFRSLPDSSAITRLSDGLILDVNDAFTQATGYSREEAIGRTSLDLGLWRDPAARNQVASALRRDGEIGDIEFEYGRKDGSSSVGLLASRMLSIFDEPCMLTIVRDIADRQRIEMTLRDSMRRQKALLDSIPDIAWLKDAESRLIAVNEPFAAACGRTPEDLGGRTDFDIWPEDLAARYVADDAEVMRTRTRKRVEERLVSVSGEQSWIETIKTPIVGETGNVIGTSGIARDVTERRRFAEALLREKALSDTIINSLPGVFYVVAACGRMTRWNRRLADVSGYDDAAIGRMQAQEFIHPEDRADLEAAIRESFEQGHADVEARLRTVAGDTVPYIFTGMRMDADGAAYLVGMGIDISQRKTTEDALRRSEKRLQAIVSNVPVVLFGLDSAGTFTFSEGKGLEALGLKPGEVVGRSALEMYRDYPEIVQSLRLGLEGILSRAVHAMGPIVFDVLYMPVTDDRGALTELIGVAVDITDRKRTEEEVARLNDQLELRVEERTAELAAAVRELEAFSYSVSHDLRAPLRAINGYTNLLKENEGDHLSADGKALLHRVLANTLKMERLIDDILHYSRAGRRPFEPGTVNLDDLVRNVAREIAEGHPKVSIAIGELPRVSGDQTMLRQIFANLIGNAIRFSAGREKPLIEVGTRDEDGQTVFYVKDNGIGFDMRYAGKLFGMFQRMHAGTDLPGSGVGLAVVKRLVERHRGRVWAQAEPDRGAVFCFTLSPPPTLV